MAELNLPIAEVLSVLKQSLLAAGALVGLWVVIHLRRFWWL